MLNHRVIRIYRGYRLPKHGLFHQAIQPSIYELWQPIEDSDFLVESAAMTILLIKIPL